jgi:hypothetical protein
MPARPVFSTLNLSDDVGFPVAEERLQVELALRVPVVVGTHQAF